MSNDTLYMRFQFNESFAIPDRDMPGNMRVFGDILMAMKK